MTEPDPFHDVEVGGVPLSAFQDLWKRNAPEPVDGIHDPAVLPQGVWQWTAGTWWFCPPGGEFAPYNPDATEDA